MAVANDAPTDLQVLGYTIAGSGDATVKIAWPTANPANVADYSLQIDGPGNLSRTRSLAGPEPTETEGKFYESLSVLRPTQRGLYRFTLRSSSDPVWTAVAKDVAVTEAVDIAWQRRTPSFYPLVKDGYADQAEFEYSLNFNAKTRVVVENSGGDVVLSRPVQAEDVPEGPGLRSWVWGGRDNDGELVPPDSYHVTITATSESEFADPKVDSVNAIVNVETKIVTRHFNARRVGARALAATHGRCATWDTKARTLMMDCKGKRRSWARAQYSFPGLGISDSRRHFKWGARTRTWRTGVGAVHKSFSKPAGRAYAVKVRVNGREKHEVKSVFLEYDYDIRI